MKFLETIISHGDTIIVAIVAIVLGWDKLKSGTGNLRKEITADYKERNAQLEEKIRLSDEQINKIKLEMRATEKGFIEKIAHLEGQLKEKEKQAAELQATVLNRNPELETILREIREFMRKIVEQNVLQTGILQGQVKREEGIDKTSAAGTGDLMRTN